MIWVNKARRMALAWMTTENGIFNPAAVIDQTEQPMSETGQSLHFDGRPANSDFPPTPDMSLHRNSRRFVP
jgi:hypothetical protein